ncbi:MAG: DUF883 family protein [Tabrizicola sp.]|nr:DUF883 family protein [Tabrizicola sp.]
MAAATSSQKDDQRSDAYSREIEAELAELRSDIAALAKSVASLGKARLGDFAEKAGQASEQFLDTSKDSMKHLRKEIADLEAQVESHVRAHPLQALLAAVGLGFLIVLLLRR